MRSELKMLSFPKGVFVTVILAALLGSVQLSTVMAMTTNADRAMDQVKNLACKDNLTVEQALAQSIRNHSQRDIGWRMFPQQDFIDIERAVLVNKAKELRYRWRVDANGTISALSDKAQALCMTESE